MVNTIIIISAYILHYYTNDKNTLYEEIKSELALNFLSNENKSSHLSCLEDVH